MNILLYAVIIIRYEESCIRKGIIWHETCAKTDLNLYQVFDL